jgi:hypothetical protein
VPEYLAMDRSQVRTEIAVSRFCPLAFPGQPDCRTLGHSYAAGGRVAEEHEPRGDGCTKTAPLIPCRAGSGLEESATSALIFAKPGASDAATTEPRGFSIEGIPLLWKFEKKYEC